MDVSTWTLAQRMELPDWCFGNRILIGQFLFNPNPGTTQWAMRDLALPDPVCIWEFWYLIIETAGNFGTYRAGLADAVPVNVAQMDAATEIYPYFGIDHAGPNYIIRITEDATHVVIKFKKGMVTGGKKLVIEVGSAAGTARGFFGLLVSGLPTKIPAHLDPNTV